ncbi:unnamed protein product [Dovyalis caffra]|uniref:Uncharacterized protein n=1 Tax=Dovyalis caffra TaxID=77055 RepID=A0AAV1RGP8_9ROSI|nr:unnamed protein product [Dovyalis caffra]
MNMWKKFEELKIRGQIVEDPEQALAQFKAGLRADIKRELHGKDLYSAEHACQIATDAEEYLKHPITRKVGSQAGET